MASLKNKLTLLLLCSLVALAASQAPQGGPHGPQGGPHQTQGRNRREVAAENEQVGQDDDGSNNAPVFTTCNFTTTSVISCQDCKTRLICKPTGGLLIACRNPFRPHCDNGVCSMIPAEGC